MRLANAMAIAAPEPPLLLLDDLSDDHIELICLAAANDFCGGATVIAKLAACSRRLRAVIGDPARIARFAAVYEILSLPSPQPLRLEHLGVLETVAGLGTNRIFIEQKPPPEADIGCLSLRPGSSGPRLFEFAALMQRHASLTVIIEGHESTLEYQRREQMYGQVLSEDRAAEVFDFMQRPDIVDRMRDRFWNDDVARAAGWGNGALETHHTELFFTLDGVEVPTRGDHYARCTGRWVNDLSDAVVDAVELDSEW